MPFKTFLKVVATADHWADSRHASDDTAQQPPKAPECPQCRIAMRWYQSKLERNGSESIVHSFYCTNCAQVTHVREPKPPSAEPQVA